MSVQGVLRGVAVWVCVGGLAWADLSSREVRELQGQVQTAFEAEEWDQVGELFGQLAAANDKRAFEFMLEVAEQAPSRSGLAVALRDAALAMDDRRVLREVKRAAERSESVVVRREMIVVCGERQEWEVLIEALEDPSPAVGATAARALSEAKVDAAVDPMIERMDDLEDGYEGIWDILREELHDMLGMWCDSAEEYRSRWAIVQETGGLASVEPEGARETGGGETRTRAMFFGQSVTASRIVFVLDTSTSMRKTDPPRGLGTNSREGTTVRDPNTPPPPRKTRLERAQEEMEHVLSGLPEFTQVNIISYDSYVRFWQEPEGDAAPRLFRLNDNTRQLAVTFVQGFRPNGTTRTDEALRQAYSVEGVSCIYLLSDGAPTTYRGDDLAPEEVYDVIDECDPARLVRVHTMGFREAPAHMLREIARQTGGNYHDIE